MRTRHLAALCSALAPFALGGGWLAGWALDAGQRPYRSAPVVAQQLGASTAPTTTRPPVAASAAPSAARTETRTVTRAAPTLQPATSPPTAPTVAPSTSAAPASATPEPTPTPTPIPTPEPGGGPQADVGPEPPGVS